MAEESFIAKIQKIYRIAIPKNVYEVMKLKEGDFIKIKIEKIKK